MTEIITDNIIQPITDYKKYRRDYYRNKYANDPEYKDKKKEKARNHYVRKTKECPECDNRIKMDEDKCNTCKYKNVEMVKSKRGRKKRANTEGKTNFDPTV